MSVNASNYARPRKVQRNSQIPCKDPAGREMQPRRNPARKRGRILLHLLVQTSMPFDVLKFGHGESECTHESFLLPG